ncbi:hypothetical protein BDP27DRAFT_1407235 [Rhodocollybia butyracea]|uniref:DUF6534 domain-containing protein n=1 Tax=Rhodocollybia butyracea TaxID=206335 RepID=A0A9P5U073_9AGAR|nr:hypothetical protein BDP27DRAFT_1407235 [Rhodocollybia butyracea]
MSSPELDKTVRWRVRSWLSPRLFVRITIVSKRDIHQLAVSVFQAHIYFQENNDQLIVRVVVGLVVFFDVVHQILILHTASHWLYGTKKPRSLLGFIAVCIQSFLNWRIWRLSNFNIWATGIVSVFIVGEFGCVTGTSVLLRKSTLHVSDIIFYSMERLGSSLRVRTFEELASDLKGLSITVNALAAAGDILIAGIFVVLVAEIQDRTLYAVNTGMLTSLCAVASLIVAAPNTFIYIAFFFCMGRLYTNSLLATLNARKSIRDRGDNIHTTIGGNFSFSFRSITKPTSFLSWSSKRKPEDNTIPARLSVQIAREVRSQDYGRQTSSKNSHSVEEEYELEELSVNLLHVDLDSISLPQKVHIEVF